MALAPDDPRRQLFGTVGFDKSLAGIELTEVDAGKVNAKARAQVAGQRVVSSAFSRL